MTAIAWDKELDTAIAPERSPKHLEWCFDGVKKYQYHEPRPLSEQLIDAKSKAEDRIKKQAGKRISRLDWKATRARERLARGRGTQDKVDAVLDAREDVRIASDAAETAVNLLTTVKEVHDFTW